MKKQERRETHTNVNENKLSRSIIKTALVGFEVKIVATKICGYYLLQTNRICCSHIAFVFKFPFSTKMLAINGMFEWNTVIVVSIYSRCENNQNSTKDTCRAEKRRNVART